MDQSEEMTLTYLLLIGIIGMLIMAGSIILFFFIYQRRLFNQQAQINKMETDHQKSLLEFSIQAQEEERKRIANDLHDSIGSLLSATRLYINQFEINRKAEDILYAKQEAVQLIDKTISNIRTITRNLAPPSLERFGLVVATQDLCRTIQDLDILQVDFSFNVDQRIDIKKEMALYRIIQELTNNTLKHADASRISLRFVFQKKKLLLYYQDDGKGFELPFQQNGQLKSAGLGLPSIKTRASLINANLICESKPQEGVRVSIELDLP